MATIASLPPTINSLHPSQRSRLLKTTRKLGDILGATPHVLDTDSFSVQPSKPRRQASVREKRQGVQLLPSQPVTHSLISLPVLAKLDGHRPSPKAPHPKDMPSRIHHRDKSMTQSARPLVLRLRPPPVLTTTDSKSPTFPSSEFLDLPAPSTATPISPFFPPNKDTASLDGEEKIRRRRMAKLTRTFGENIPPELVLCPHHQRSPSEPAPRSPWRSEEWAPSKTAATAAFTTINRDCTSAPAKAEASAPLPTTRRHKRRSLSVGDIVHRPSAKGTEWNGEWNIKDADKRAMALRNLRSR